MRRLFALLTSMFNARCDCSLRLGRLTRVQSYHRECIWQTSYDPLPASIVQCPPIPTTPIPHFQTVRPHFRALQRHIFDGQHLGYVQSYSSEQTRRNRHQAREQEHRQWVSRRRSHWRYERGATWEYRAAGFHSGQVRHSAHVRTFTWGASTGWWQSQNTSSTRDSVEVSCSTAAPNRPHSQVHGT